VELKRFENTHNLSVQSMGQAYMAGELVAKQDGLQKHHATGRGMLPMQDHQLLFMAACICLLCHAMVITDLCGATPCSP